MEVLYLGMMIWMYACPDLNMIVSLHCGTSLPQEDIFFRIRKTLLVTGNLFPKFAKIILLFCRRNEKLGSIIPGFFWIFFLLTVFRMAS